MYYNTTNEQGKELKKAKKKAKGQDNLILEFFKTSPLNEFTPSMVHRHLFDEKTPLTSVRRAISNLTRDNLLHKTNKKAMGSYGRLEFYWTYSPVGVDQNGQTYIL